MNILRRTDEIPDKVGNRDDLQGSWDTIDQLFKEYHLKVIKAVVCGRSKLHVKTY
jgi:hypothetical protein